MQRLVEANKYAQNTTFLNLEIIYKIRELVNEKTKIPHHNC